MDKKVLVQDLSEGLVRRKGLSQEDAMTFVRTVFDLVGEFLQTDKIVKIKGLGTFKLVTVDSRESVDVNTGERIVIKEYTKVNFTPDPVLRDAVNKPFAQFETVILNEGTNLEDMERMDDEGVERIYHAGQDGNVEDMADGQSGEQPQVTEGCEEDHSVDFYDKERNLSGNTGNETALPIETASIEEGAEDEAEGPVSERAGEETGNEAEEQFQESLVEDDEAQASGESEADDGEEEAAPVFENPGQEEPEACGIQDVRPGQDERHVSNVHVASQQIEVQKVEHQKVEHQHIVQVAPEHGRHRVYLTPWMMFFLVLLVLFLMAVSYYAGSQLHSGEGTSQKADSPDKPAESLTVKSGQNASPRKLAADSLKMEADSLKPENSGTRADTVSTVVKKETPPQPKVEYPQVEGGAYEIVGIQERHRMRSGETLRGLALKYYGSKDFTVYLVVQNKIANPDIVPEGMWLEIPKLRLKRR